MNFLGSLLGKAPIVSSSQSTNNVTTSLRPAHPRLFVTSQTELHTAFRPSGSSLLRNRLLSSLVALADLDLTSPPIERDQSLIGADGKRVQFHHEARKVVSVVFDCCAAFFCTGQRKYRDFAVGTMRRVVGFDDWNGPEKFLDLAEMSLAVSVGYDWLYNDLDEEERGMIADGLLRHSLVFAPAAYALVDPTCPAPGSDGGGMVSGQLEWVRKDNNGNLVNNCGLLAAALAIGDLHPSLLQTVLSGIGHSLPHSMQAYEPDGAWHEGPQYWSYGTQFAVYLVAMLESAVGSDLGLVARFPGFSQTALYRYFIVSPAGLSFNYGDTGQDYMSSEPHYTWLAQRFGHAQCEQHALGLLEDKVAKAERKGPKKQNKFDRCLALHALWFPADAASAASHNASSGGGSSGSGSSSGGDVEQQQCPAKPLDRRFRGKGEIAILCSSWTDPHATYLGLKAGSNGNTHGHLDLGSFVLDSMGQRWSLDFGGDDYALPGYASKVAGSPRWDYLRTSNRGHSTVTVGEAERSGGARGHVSAVLQLLSGQAPLTHFLSSPARGHAAADLSSAYPLGARGRYRHVRGAALLDGRRRVLVQDDFIAPADNGSLAGLGVIWRMYTAATVTVLSARRAELRLGGRVMGVELVGEAGGGFVVLSGAPGEEGPWEGGRCVEGGEEGDEEGGGEEDEEEDEEDEEEGVDESALTDKERRKLASKREKRAARHEERQRERDERRAARGKPPKPGKEGNKEGKKEGKEGRATGRADESEFRRGVDRSQVREAANEGVSCLAVAAVLGGTRSSIAVVFSPEGAGPAAPGTEHFPPIDSWDGRI